MGVWGPYRGSLFPLINSISASYWLTLTSFHMLKSRSLKDQRDSLGCCDWQVELCCVSILLPLVGRKLRGLGSHEVLLQGLTLTALLAFAGASATTWSTSQDSEKPRTLDRMGIHSGYRKVTKKNTVCCILLSLITRHLSPIPLLGELEKI